MAEPRSPLKEFRHLDEKLHTVGLSSVEQARWESLQALVSPGGEPARAAGAMPGGFDVDAAAAALRASLVPAGLRTEPVLEPGPPAGPEWQPASEAVQEWRPAAAQAWAQAEAAAPAAVGETWPPPPEEAADPWQAGPVEPAADVAWDPNAAGGYEAAPWDGELPQQGAWDPNATAEATPLARAEQPPDADGLPLIEELSLEEISFEGLGLAGQTPPLAETAAEMVPQVVGPFEAQFGQPLDAAADGPAEGLETFDEATPMELASAAEFLSLAGGPPPTEGALEIEELDLEGVPEVSADEIEEIVEALGEAPPAAAMEEPSEAWVVEAPAPQPPEEASARPEPEPADAAGTEVVSLEAIAIMPPPPGAEALAPPLPLPQAAAGEPPALPPAPVAPPMLVPQAPSAIEEVTAVFGVGEVTASFPVEPAPAVEAKYAVGPQPLPEVEPQVQEPPPAPGRAEAPGAESAAPAGAASAGPASWGTTPTFIAGEHRVVLHTVEGQVLRGALADADLVDHSVPLHLPSGEVQHFPASRLKAVFFMLAPGGAPPSALGTKVRVTFADGRQVAGMSPDYAPGAVGFFVVPLDTRTNTGRIWVYRDAVRQISLG